MSRKIGTKSRFGVEHLESRLMMAGQAIVNLSPDGTLNITGDAAANGVLVRQGNTANSIVVTGLETAGGADTNLRLSAQSPVQSQLTFNNVKNLKINMGNGNDVVLIDAISSVQATGSSSAGPLAGNAYINLGGGTDTLRVGTTQAFGSSVLPRNNAGAVIQPKSDANAPLNAVVINGRLDIYGEANNDTVDIVDTDVRGAFFMDAGTGNDTVDIRQSTNADVRSLVVAGNTTVNLGEGSDSMYVNAASFFGNVNFNAAGGTDRLEVGTRGHLVKDGNTVNSVHFNSSANVNMGANNDYFASVGSFVEDSLNLDMGTQNDTVLLTRNNVEIAFLNGGANLDMLTESNNTVRRTRTVVNFEG